MTQTLITRGDILKSEADPMSRISVKADNIKMGQLVEHPMRKQFLVALSDSEHGQVLVQPHNCVINLDFVAESAITGKSLTVATFIKQGDAHGIKYIGTPYTGD